MPAPNKIQSSRDWQFAIPLKTLRKKKQTKVRINGQQVALFESAGRVFACHNNCPHEGYPLSEGHATESCILTCNWHNWKFNLETGDNLFGGDRLRIFPAEIRNGEVWVDMTAPPPEIQREQIMQNLAHAFVDYRYDQIGREIARWLKCDSDPMDVLRQAITWSWQKMEFGWTHAYAGMADWLALYHEHPDPETRLVCLTESVAHAAFDVLREKVYPYSDDSRPYDEDAFLDAIESEREADAISLVRGGVSDGLGFEAFEPALTRAALAHYNDFGHSLIYVTKAGQLVEQLGTSVLEPLLLSLVRSLVYATREDHIPEFRLYAKAQRNWGSGEDSVPHHRQWQGQGINAAVETTLRSSGAEPLALYRALLMANAHNMLCFDIAQQDKTHVTVSGNVGWLDFTHGLTFASAVRIQCEKFPDLWPRGLLQMALFSGRNAGYTRDDQAPDRWLKSNVGIDEEMQSLLDQSIDHGQGEHIVSVHLLKTALAVRTELTHIEPDQQPLLVAAVKRFFHSPLRRRQPRRTAYQSMQFVARE